MADITPLNRLTGAHRCLIQRIQDLCIEVSLSSATHVAECQYFGHTHEITVRAIPRYNLGEGDSFVAEWDEHIYLPGGPPPVPRSAEQAMQALGDVLERLEALLPTPGGAA